jgi:hypothetical protein
MANFSGRRCDLIESSFTGVQRYMGLGLTLREKPQRLLALSYFFVTAGSSIRDTSKN